jgi:hypothetical protein
MMDAKPEALVESEILIASILTFLYKNGTKRVEVSAIDVCQFEPTEGGSEFFDDAMLWLRDEKIIRFDQYTEESYLDVTLTAFGFSILGQKLIGDANGDTVVKVAEKISADRSYISQAGELAGSFVGGLVKTMGSG